MPDEDLFSRARGDMWERNEAIRLARELGGVDLERPRRTIGFERRQERADQRPRTAPSWGIAPRSDDY